MNLFFYLLFSLYPLVYFIFALLELQIQFLGLYFIFILSQSHCMILWSSISAEVIDGSRWIFTRRNTPNKGEIGSKVFGGCD